MFNFVLTRVCLLWLSKLNPIWNPKLNRSPDLKVTLNVFFFKQKTAYEITRWLEFRRVLFRSKIKLGIISTYIHYSSCRLLDILWVCRLRNSSSASYQPDIYYLLHTWTSALYLQAKMKQNVWGGEWSSNYDFIQDRWNSYKCVLYWNNLLELKGASKILIVML